MGRFRAPAVGASRAARPPAAWWDRFV